MFCKRIVWLFCFLFVLNLSSALENLEQTLTIDVAFLGGVWLLLSAYMHHLTEIRFLSLMMMTTTAITTRTEITIAMIDAAFIGSFLTTL